MTRPIRSVALTLVGALGLATLGAGAASAGPPATLVVHYAGPGEPAIEGVALEGSASVTGTGSDEFGQWTQLTFPSAADDSALGFRVAGDSAFAEDVRYVWADGDQAETWVIDGDPRAYAEPQRVPEEQLRIENRRGYVDVDVLSDLLGVGVSTGRNGYQFDGYATGSLDILTLTRGRDYHEIAMDIDRFASNATGRMLSNYTNLVFQDIDGIRVGEDYFLSLASVERLLQIGTHIDHSGTYLLDTLPVAHDSLGTADPEQLGFSADGLADLERFAQQQVDAGWPGLAVVVTKDGQTVLEQAWGDALVSSTGVDSDGTITEAAPLPEADRVPATTDTVWDLASNTKMYATNYAIQRLVSEGLLDLDATIASFPGWENFTDANSEYTGKWTVGGEGGIEAVYTGKETIRVRDLLNHRAGLIPDPEYPNLTSAGDLWYQTDDPDDRTGIIDAVSRTPLMYAPRTTFAYSDVDYMILGLLVEQVSGQRLDAYLEENFYGPLGLTDTMFNPLQHGIDASQVAATELNGNTRDGNVSFGEFEGGDPVPMREYTLQGEVHDEKAWYSMAGVAGHAGLFSTTSDMAVLTQLMLNQGLYGGQEYFSADVVEEFLAPTPGNGSYGLGWRLHTNGGQGYYYFNWGPSRYTYGHQGWTGTLTVIDPVHQMTITILTNMRHAPVVSPPNGFEAGSMPLANLVPVSAYVYRALTGIGDDYTVATALEDVTGIEVPFGTAEADALAGLAPSTTLTDSDGGTHEVPVTWTLEGYSPQTPGTVAASGIVELPATVLQDSDDPITLELTSTVTVLAEEPVDPDPTDPGTPTNPTEPGDPTGPATDDTDPTDPGEPTGGHSAGGDLPQTGASGTGALIGAAAVALLAGAVLLILRRLRHQR
ncbi:penicillin binding protein PBP4B [Ruania alkalisoli]|uniref:Penicillin binding protein PBP4B n=1 Tax=Ruania alkalisoli TaxID=2779775 RepID=A0A7M1SZ28_9MICO|nr:penicillin binding protein PBP4B [Ruania alkalisoli]QOR72836.1 penicillin binding protein PBP4B [Ruania alkalisoli]